MTRTSTGAHGSHAPVGPLFRGVGGGAGDLKILFVDGVLSIGVHIEFYRSSLEPGPGLFAPRAGRPSDRRPDRRGATPTEPTSGGRPRWFGTPSGRGAGGPAVQPAAASSPPAASPAHHLHLSWAQGQGADLHLQLPSSHRSSSLASPTPVDRGLRPRSAPGGSEGICRLSRWRRMVASRAAAERGARGQAHGTRRVQSGRRVRPSTPAS